MSFTCPMTHCSCSLYSLEHYHKDEFNRYVFTQWAIKTDFIVNFSTVNKTATKTLFTFLYIFNIAFKIKFQVKHE